MNKVEFNYEMQKHGDTQSTLAKSMGISRTRLNSKVNERNGATFTQIEIKFIMSRYNLSVQRMTEFFLQIAYRN